MQGSEDAKNAAPCFLCVSAEQRSSDYSCLVVATSKHSFAVLNRFPYAAGHIMVSPKRHCAQLADLDAEEYADMMVLLRHCVAAIDAVFAPHGCNVGLNLGAAAGAGVPGHVHAHIVPRWDGDTNFMSVVSGTRVISDDLHSTWTKLVAWFTQHELR